MFLQKAAVARDMPAIQRGLSGSLQDARTLVILREFPDCRPRSSPSADAIYASINMAPPPVSTEHRQAPTLEGAAWGKNAPRDSGTLYLVNPHSLRLSSLSPLLSSSPSLTVLSPLLSSRCARTDREEATGASGQSSSPAGHRPRLTHSARTLMTRIACPLLTEARVLCVVQVTWTPAGWQPPAWHKPAGERRPPAPTVSLLPKPPAPAGSAWTLECAAHAHHSACTPYAHCSLCSALCALHSALCALCSEFALRSAFAESRMFCACCRHAALEWQRNRGGGGNWPKAPVKSGTLAHIEEERASATRQQCHRLPTPYPRPLLPSPEPRT